MISRWSTTPPAAEFHDLRPRWRGGLALVAIITSLALLAPSHLRAQAADIGQLRARVQSLGLTPDQLRERLKAAGYDESLLDAYAKGGTLPASPSPDVLRAVEALSQGLAAERAQAIQQSQVRPLGVDTVTVKLGDVPVFGLDIFRRATTQFEPATSGPVDAGYRLGASDVVVVILTGSVELSHSLEVTREGFVVVPQVGQVYVANLTLGQATDVLRRRFAQSYSSIGSTAQLSVTVARLRTNQVFVLGEVAAPGSYQVSAAGTMLTALYAAGGPTVNGTLRKVELRRGGKIVATLDAYDYLLRGDASRDVRLEQGDVLFVGRHAARVRATGEVLRPGWYEAKAGERIADVLTAAGGLSATAVRSRVLVTRVLPFEAREPGRDRASFDVSGEQLAVFGVEDGDVVSAFPVSERVRGRIVVSGHVHTPGPQGLRTGMTVREALVSAGGLRPGAYTDEVVIRRRRADASFERVAVRLTAAGLPVDDLALQEEDSLTVYSREQFTPDRYVSVGGAVREAKQVVWTPGLTLRRALLEAGGLEESALLTEVEVARMPATRDGGLLASTQRVAIDSSYLFERRPDGTYFGPPGLKSAQAGTAAEVLLQPYDVVNVLRQPDFEYLGSVSVGGEVKFPGTYAITRKGERLADVIRRAGGLTAEADADGASFFRQHTDRQRAEQSRALRFLRLTAATTSGTTLAGAGATTGAGELAAASGYREAVAAFLSQGQDDNERVNVDLPLVLRDATTQTNFELQSGDVLTVPKRNPTVTVRGFVNAPVTVAWTRGAHVSEYISRAGGGTFTADQQKAFVVQPNGSVESYRHRWWIIPDRDPVVRAGGLVVVPSRDITDRPLSFTQVIGPIVQILSSTVAIIAVTRRF